MHLLGLWPPPKTCSSSSSPKSLTRTRTNAHQEQARIPLEGSFPNGDRRRHSDERMHRSVGWRWSNFRGEGDRISSSRLVRKSIFAYQVMEEEGEEGSLGPTRVRPTIPSGGKEGGGRNGDCRERGASQEGHDYWPILIARRNWVNLPAARFLGGGRKWGSVVCEPHGRKEKEEKRERDMMGLCAAHMHFSLHPPLLLSGSDK